MFFSRLYSTIQCYPRIYQQFSTCLSSIVKLPLKNYTQYYLTYIVLLLACLSIHVIQKMWGRIGFLGILLPWNESLDDLHIFIHDILQKINTLFIISCFVWDIVARTLRIVWHYVHTNPWKKTLRWFAPLVWSNLIKQKDGFIVGMSLVCLFPDVDQFGSPGQRGLQHCEEPWCGLGESPENRGGRVDSGVTFPRLTAWEEM